MQTVANDGQINKLDEFDDMRFVPYMLVKKTKENENTLLPVRSVCAFTGHLPDSRESITQDFIDHEYGAGPITYEAFEGLLNMFNYTLGPNVNWVSHEYVAAFFSKISRYNLSDEDAINSFCSRLSFPVIFKKSAKI